MLTLSSTAPPSTATLPNLNTSRSPSNGDDSPLEHSVLTNDDAPYDSESALSEVAVAIVDQPSPASSTHQQSDFGAEGTDAEESSAAEAQGESDDAEFDMEDSPAPVVTNGERDGSSSADSRRPLKRKAAVEDQHMLANPELYGLRRSVSFPLRYKLLASLLTWNSGSTSPTPPHSMLPATLYYLLPHTLSKGSHFFRLSLMMTMLIMMTPTQMLWHLADQNEESRSVHNQVGNLPTLLETKHDGKLMISSLETKYPGHPFSFSLRV